MAEFKFNWVDNPTASGVAECNTDILNDCLMHLKYDNDGGTGLQMFDTILKDHILTYEETKGLALQGTYVYKNALAGSSYGYPDFYNKVIEEYNQATTTETVNSVTIKVHSNGHKFYDIANKTAIDEFFNSMGSAWFYGVDTANGRIFLPRNNYFEQATGDASEVGLSVEAGLPDHNHTVSYEGSSVDDGDPGSRLLSTPSGANGTYTLTSTKASTSNSTYGNSNTVQPNAVKKLLYICVGNTVADTSWVDVVTQVEGGVKDLEDATNEGIERLKASSTALTQTQITNCLLEVPQRIKYTLVDGTLTILAGSVAIFPYGTEDLSAQYPIGSEFLDSNLKVIDTNWDGSNFFVWAETQVDIPQQYGGVKTDLFTVLIINPTGIGTAMTSKSFVTSGSTEPSTVGSRQFWYDTTNNYVKNYSANTTEFTYASLPSMIVSTTEANKFEINQIFSGMGYIGSTVWVDKGVKGLIPNGRNEDGTLNNREFVTNKVITKTKTGTLSNEDIRLDDTRLDVGALVYDERENWNTSNGAFRGLAVVGKISMANNVITSFQPKLPFRAVDYSDKSEVVSWGMPDYSAGVVAQSMGSSTTNTFTAQFDGYIYISAYVWSNTPYYITINGIKVDEFKGEWSGQSSQCFNFVGVVKRGDIIKTYYDNSNTNSQVKSVRFFPMKGAN